MAMTDSLMSINERIAAALNRRASTVVTGREVTVVAASKYVGFEGIIEAANAGITIFGENRIQDLKDKVKNIARVAPEILEKITFHMIGHLQTNKARDAVYYNELIQSVDSLRLAEKLDEYSGKLSKKTGVLIEVKTSSEETKSGIDPEEAIWLADKIESMPNLEFSGIMTMAELTDDREKISGCFDLAHSVFSRLKKSHGDKCRYLSMGMSDDFETAIERGANMVRLGRVLFK